MKWTLQEDIELLKLARKYFLPLVHAGCINAESLVSKNMHVDFASETRDAAAILFRLKNAGMLKFADSPGQPARQQLFKCTLRDDLSLYDFSVCPEQLKIKLHPETTCEVVERFSDANVSRDLEVIITMVATSLELEPMLVQKVLIEHELLVVDEYRNYVRPGASSATGSLMDKIRAHTPDKRLIDNINTCRARASELYYVHERDGAEVLFSSDGTGFGKSYGVHQSYVDYIERFAATQDPDRPIPDRGFTNLLYMSPQKSQIGLRPEQISRIVDAGGEFICVMARKDVYDLDFVNWATGQTNRKRYKQWYDSAKGKKRIGSALDNINYLIVQIDRCQERIEQLDKFGSEDAVNDKEIAKEQLLNYQRNLARTIEKACETLFNRKNPEQLIVEYIEKGIRARRRRQDKAELALQQGKNPPKMTADEVYLEIIKQVLPFEVCQFRPSVLLMTTNKFDTTTKRIVPRERGEGGRFVNVAFDHVVGGKLKPEEPRISTVSGSSHQEQVDYLLNEHFQQDPVCSFRNKDIRFTVVIDELHEAYVRLEDSCHVKLVTKENNLAHVFSVTRRIYRAVKSLEHQGKPEDMLTDFEKEKVRFITALRDLLQDKCELSSGTTLENVLDMFQDQLGAFEVNGDAAERIISITRNIFSFNAKMFVNEQALKRIRMRNSDGDTTRTELYYEVEGDTSDTNPTLHDLFQLVSAILAACFQITNSHFKRWVKNGGQDNASSQNTPLSQFVDAANNVAGEVRHIFERTTDEELEIDHFYTYFQPKTVFTLTPVAELNYVNRGAERTVILAFELDLVKELPEAMLLRLLTGTNNKVIGLSATSGFTHTKNGNFSRQLLNRYARELDYRVLERQPGDISMLKELRELRAAIRKVTFKTFDAELPRLTDIYRESAEFRAVYDAMFEALKKEVEHVIRNPYKLRQFSRELEALLLAAYDGKNSLVLSLSGEFKGAFARAYRRNQTNWRNLYGMSSRCDKLSQEKRHDKILEFTPFKGRNKLRVVFFDAALARSTDVTKETYVRERGMSLVFMSTYNSAGTGLNYFVKYKDGAIGDEGAPALDVDFQRLVLVNSSFYSEVMNGSTNLNTLPNFVSILKHYADDSEIHLMRDLSVNFAQGENYRLLMAEHCMSLFKVIVQAIGRGERRDTLLNTEIFLPDDVMHNVAFQFSGLGEDQGNSVVLESMSLLNYRLKEHCDKLSARLSFADEADRQAFEKAMLSDGKRIDQVHKKVLKNNWINKVRKGRQNYLGVCNLFREHDSFADPARWLEKLRCHPIIEGNRQMMSILDKMYISRKQGNETILLCHKRGPDGLPDKRFDALSDFAGGAREYRPELMIFPQYSKNADYSSGNIVGKLLRHFGEVQKTAFVDLMPHPSIVPLLKGNVGEHMFDMLLDHYQLSAMNDDEVFDRLGPQVYEFFDRFIEIGNVLLCVDVKNWATKLDNFERAEETLEKSRRKIRRVRDIAEQKVELYGEAQIRKALAGRYDTIKFVYLNTTYSQNPNNLMWEENVEHTVHYLNLFQLEHEYYRPRDRQTKRLKDLSKLGTNLQVNPILKTLLGL